MVFHVIGIIHVTKSVYLSLGIKKNLSKFIIDNISSYVIDSHDIHKKIVLLVTVVVHVLWKWDDGKCCGQNTRWTITVMNHLSSR